MRNSVSTLIKLSSISFSRLSQLRTSRLAATSIACVLLAGSWLVGCERPPLTIGTVLPLSGEDAAYGLASRQGMELAHDHLKAQNRATKLILRFEDSQSDPATALAHFETLVADRAVLTVGGFTPGEAAILAPAADERKRVVLSPTSQDQLLGTRHDYFYRLAPSAAVTGTTIATFSASDLDFDRLVLVAQSKAQGDALAEGLESFDGLGGEPVSRFDLDTASLDEALTEIRSIRPDAVVLAGWGAWLPETLEALRDARFRGRVFVPESFAAPSIRSQAEASRKSVLIASSHFEPDADRDATRTFAAAYRERYGEDPDLFAAAGWDTMLVLAAAFEDRPNLPGEVRQWLRDDVKEIQGVTGHLQFDEHGATTKYPRVYSLADDLTLVDHGRWLEQEKQRLAEKKERLEQQRRELLRQMAADAAAEDREDLSGGAVASSG